MRRHLVLTATLLAGILTGCVADPDTGAGGDEPAAAIEVPTGCSRQAASMRHGPGAATHDGAHVPTLHPCLVRTGFRTLEPTIGITETGTVFIGPGVDRYRGAANIYGVLRGQDDGATWDVVFPEAAGVAPTHPTTQDPYLFVDPTTSRIFAEDLVIPPFNCGSISWSDDDGASWDNGLSGCAQFDHVTLFTGPPTISQTQDYPNVVYRCAISGGALAGYSTMIACQRSLDGARTWMPPGEPAFVFPPGVLMNTAADGCSGGNGHGATDADGRVFLPRGHCGQPWLAYSDDEGLSWETVQVADLGLFCDASLCEHDAGVAVDAAGTVYYAWVAADRLPYLVRSTDGGATWDEPIMIGFPGLVETSHIQLIAGGAGRIAFVYLGSTSSPGAPWAGDYTDVTWGGHIGISLDADATDPSFETVTINETGDPFIRGRCGPLRCQEVFDFIDIRIAPDGTPWAPLVDGCSGPCATGEESADNDDEAVAGRVWGVDLWGEADPNGPYPGP